MQNQNYLRKIAIISGVGYLIIFITGIYANFVVLESLLNKTDAVATLTNIQNNLPQFRMGILAFILMVLFDLILTWGLYILFIQVDKNLSLFAAFFRLVNTAIFAVGIFHLFDVLELASSKAYLLSMEGEYIQAEVMRSLSSFNYIWLIGLLFFGIHLFALGVLVLRSGFVPTFIGYLLLLAGAGYLVDSNAQFLLTNYLDYQNIFTFIVVVPGVVGELSITIWLLVKGGRNGIKSG